MQHAVLLKKHGRVYVFAPYNPEFVVALKEEIPWHARKWEPDAKRWSVAMEYLPSLENVAISYYEVDVAVTENATPPPPPPTGGHSVSQCLAVVRRVYQEEAELGIFPPADSEPIIRAVYRARALLTHPDVAGAASHDAMVRLNRAYDTLLKRVARVSS